MRKYFLALMLLSTTINIGFASTPSWLTIKAQRGDHISSLLSKYNLYGSQCNRNQFYQLNRLKSSSLLRTGKTYKLPILRYQYNGRSIRSTIRNINWEKAIKIKRFNKKLRKKGLKRTSFINNKDLWASYQDLGCSNKNVRAVKRKLTKVDKQRKSVRKKRMNFPIFGAKYARFSAVSNRLKGKVFYLVGGHGGPDPGAIGQRAGHKLCEDEYGYDVTLRLARRLLANGAIVHVILRDPNDGIRDQKYLKCDRDEVYLGNKRISRSQKPRLKDRAFIINNLFYSYKRKGYKSKDQITLMLHIDSRNKKKQIDVFFYHAPKSRRSKKVAKRLYRIFKSKYRYFQTSRSYTGRVLSRDLFMLMNLKPLGVYFELANIRNASDQRRLILPQNRESLAKWITEGLMAHYRR
jgi:N-acetylmuramoyl-L-alanine amidase